MLSLVTLSRTATSVLQLAAFRFLLFCLRITSILYLLLNALHSFLFIPIICSVDLACLNWILYSCQCNGCNVYWHYINTVSACDCPLFQILPSLSVTGVMLVAVILCNSNGFWSCACFFLYEFVKILLLLDRETYHAVPMSHPHCETYEVVVSYFTDFSSTDIVSA